MRLFRAPFVLEGGSFLVDGEGTLITTEQCLLNPNRNPDLTRDEIEQGLRDYLGVTTVVWLPVGHSLDVGPEGTDGHVDGVAQYVAPGHVLLEAPADPTASEHRTGQENLERLRAARDAGGRSFRGERARPGTARERVVREPLPRERRRDRPGRRRRERRTGPRLPRDGVSGPGGGRPSPGRRSPSAAAARTASPSRSRRVRSLQAEASSRHRGNTRGRRRTDQAAPGGLDRAPILRFRAR